MESLLENQIKTEKKRNQTTALKENQLNDFIYIRSCAAIDEFEMMLTWYSLWKEHYAKMKWKKD